MKKKTIVISEKLHHLVKLYCVKNNLKLNDWIESQLQKIINKNE
jgi:predicted HicB family RNase H-like nuclease